MVRPRLSEFMINTIGYEGASLGDFIRSLKSSKIECLVDVRERAQSRRKGFSKSALSAALKAEGIEYMHLRDLGDPKLGREAARKGQHSAFRTIYAAVISTKEGRAAIRTIIDVASEKSVCLMCYERDPMSCHRKMITDKIQTDTGLKIRHLGVAGLEHKARSKRRMLHPREGAAAQI